MSLRGQDEHEVAVGVTPYTFSAEQLASVNEQCCHKNNCELTHHVLKYDCGKVQCCVYAISIITWVRSSSL